MKGRPRNTGRKVSEAEFRRMWADLSVSVEEIGRRLGISGNAVKMRAKRRGLPDRPRGRPFARRHDHDRMVRLYRAGLSMAAVAQAVGCREHTVLQALRRAGEPSRERHDPITTGSLLQAVMAASARETKAAMSRANMVDRISKVAA